MPLFTIAILSFVAIVTTGSSAQQCERCSPVCGRSDIVTLTCQAPFPLTRGNCSTLNVWKVNNTLLNRDSPLYNVTSTCNDSHVISTVMFRTEEDTYGYYDCVDTDRLTFSIFHFNQNCCEPISIGVGCTQPMRPSATNFMQSSAVSTISTSLELSISTTSLVPTPSSPPESPSFVIPSNILYAATACVVLVVLLLVLISILVCTIQCWKKRLSKRITVDKHKSFEEKSPPGDIIQTEIKSTSLSYGSRTINISSPVPDPSQLRTSSPQTIVIIPPATPSTPPTPQDIGFSHSTSPTAAKGYNKLFVTPQNPELLTRSPSPEAMHVYSQLNHMPEEGTTRVPIPVVPPQVPPLNNSPNQCIQDSVAAKEHLYFMLDTPEQLQTQQENFNPSSDSAENEGHIYQVLETFNKSSRLGNETSPINRTNTLLPPPPLHTSNDYAEINMYVVSQENKDIPPPPPRQPPPSSKPPLFAPSPPSRPPPPLHPPPPPSCPPPPSHPPPPPTCPPPPSHPPPPPSCPPPPSHPPPPPSCPPPPSRPPPPSHPPPPSISPPIQSTIPRHRPTDYEDISKTQTLPKKPTNSSKKLPPAEYEIPMSKTLPRRPKPPRHDPDEDVEEVEPSTFVRGFSLSVAQPQPFVASVQQRSFRRLQPPKQLTLSYDRLPMQVDMKSEESPPGSNLRRHNSQKVKMKIRHNDRIKITTSPHRPTIAPPHFAKSPSQSPQNENNESLLVLNDVPLHEAEYDRLRLKH